MVSLYNFRTYLFPLGEVNASFLNLLSTVLNTKQNLKEYSFATVKVFGLCGLTS